jgi:hypothetical protein
MKLSNQLKSRATGGKRISDLVGSGSENWDQKAKALIPRDEGARARVSVADMLISKGPRMLCVILTASLKPDFWCSYYVSEQYLWRTDEAGSGKKREEDKYVFLYLLCIVKANHFGAEEPPISKRGIFDSLTIYVNGSTSPLISDHKLKYLLAEHGAKISIHLGRRQVTHVILGNPCGRAGGTGAGGGLAATKIQKEIKRTGGCGIRYVSVEWYIIALHLKNAHLIVIP